MTSTEHVTRKRRKYTSGKPCDDCGRAIPTTQIHFWVNNMPYIVCKDCIKPYRGRINKPCSCEGN